MLYYNNKKNAQKNFSIVKGFLEGIILDGKINSQEIKSLQNWINNILDSSDLGGYKGYFIGLHTESCLPTFDIERVQNLILEVQEFEYELDNYSVEDTEYQILVGILKGLIADEKIADDEVIGLKEWLKKNSHLSNRLIYKQLLDIVNSSDENGLNKKLKIIINDFLCSDKNRKEIHLNESDFANYTFCFTGNFINWTRAELVKQLRERGVEIKSSISKKINFLIIGEIKNASNKYHDFGTKTDKVRALQEKGAEIEILYEGQIVNSFNNFLNVNLKD